MKPALIGGVDIGGTKIAVTVANSEGPLARITAPTIKTGSERAVAEQVLTMLDQACRQAGVDAAQVNDVGVSSCGPFVKLAGLIGLSSPNICGGIAERSDLENDWTVIPLEAILRERFDRVVIVNDCIAALSAERTFGAVLGEPDCAYVTWSTGIGFGLCVDGNMLFGKNGNAGHAGHMLMDSRSNAVCGCGNRGDLEAMISGRNLDYASPLTTPELFNAARAGDPQARRQIEEAAQWFGRALYNLTAILDIRTFVIGGSVWMHHGDWLMPLVRQEIDSRFAALTQGVNVVPAALGPFVADIGALSLVMPSPWIARWLQMQPWQTLA